MTSNVNHAGDTMNLPSGRSIRENTINKEPTDSIITAKNKSKPKPAVISYDYEAAISQPDISTCLEIDNNTQDPFCPNSGRSSTIVLETKKTVEIRPRTRDVINIEKDSIFSSEITRDTENVEKRKNNVIANCETSSNFQDSIYLRDIKKSLNTIENRKNLVNKIAHIHQETGNSYKKENYNKINKNVKLCDFRNKTSKIPRLIKPNFFMSRESQAYQKKKLSAKSKFIRSTNIKSPMTCSEEETNSGNNLKKEALNMVKYQKSKTEDFLQIGYGNSVNSLYSEKNSEMDADEEDLPTPINKSQIITAAGDDPRSTTLLKCMTLKCLCQSCNNHKCSSPTCIRQYTETDSWSSPETENARKWQKKLIKHHKFNTSSENLDLLSDYNVNNNVKAFENDEKSKEREEKIRKRSLTNNFAKSFSTENSAGMKTYRTASLSFFNVFFDIVFWPFVFFRAKH